MRVREAAAMGMSPSAASARSDNRVLFDFSITFANGGGLRGQRFRLDIEGDTIDDAALAAYLVRDLRLLMVESVRVFNKTIVEETHQRRDP